MYTTYTKPASQTDVAKNAIHRFENTEIGIAAVVTPNPQTGRFTATLIDTDVDLFIGTTYAIKTEAAAIALAQSWIEERR